MNTCPHCNASMIGVEYGYPHPERYDGVSEYQCSNTTSCGARFGRWTGKQLDDDEAEPRFGIKTPTKQTNE